MADWWGNNANTGGSWWGGGTQSSGLGPMGGAVARNTYNAKNLPLGDPYVAAENYGVTVDNVGDKWGKIWANRTNKAGGSKQIFDKVSDWASPEKIRARGGDPNDLQWQLVNEAIRTGRVDPRLKPETLRRGMGVGLSETARHQQHKKSFLDTWLGKALTIGGQAALSFVPGVGPLLSAGLGGITGAMNGGGFLGGLTGALQGYGVGSGTQWLNRGLSSGFGYGAGMTGSAVTGGSGANSAFTLGPGGRVIRRGASIAAQTLRNRERRQPRQP